MADRNLLFIGIYRGIYSCYQSFTHVSGIVGGSGKLSGEQYSGMAPACDIYSVKVLDSKGQGNISRVLKGIRWVLCHQIKYNIKIVNISVGTLPTINSSDEARLVAGVEELWNMGMVVVTAAGNYGPQKGSITTPGISKKVITVGSSNDQFYIDSFGHKIKDYSGRGPTFEFVFKPDILAPGSYITSCNAQYLKQLKSPYTVKSGTSMSTPVVSGAIALLLSKYPDMNNVEVKLRLRESSTDLGLSMNQQGWGLLNVEKLICI
ncbi:MAG: S8 family peptidase [Lachnospiraceae bacterium]